MEAVRPDDGPGGRLSVHVRAGRHAQSPSNCPMKITDALLAEHVAFHSLFDHLEQVAPGLETLAEVRVLGNLLEAMLLRHSHAEDRLLMEYLDDSIEQIGQRETFHDEHELIDRHLGAVRNAPSVEAGRKLLLEAVAGARKHFDKEERLIFPLAEKVISYHNIMKLGSQWLSQHGQWESGR